MSERLELLKKHLKEDPEDSFLLFALAKEYEKKEDYSKAQSYYEILKQKDSNYIGLYYHLGKLFEMHNDIDKAVEIYKEGIVRAKEQKDFHAASELNGALEGLGSYFEE